jgi:hypothetical protein
MDLQKLTSTSSSIATTRKSSSEFLHPTITPGEVVLGMSSGQNILIKPSCSGMTISHSSKGPPTSKLFTCRDSCCAGPWMLNSVSAKATLLVRTHIYIYIPDSSPVMPVFPQVLLRERRRSTVSQSLWQHVPMKYHVSPQRFNSSFREMLTTTP